MSPTSSVDPVPRTPSVPYPQHLTRELVKRAQVCKLPLPKKREKNRVSEWIRGHAEGKKEKIIYPVICVARSVSEKEIKGSEVISPV